MSHTIKILVHDMDDTNEVRALSFGDQAPSATGPVDSTIADAEDFIVTALGMGWGVDVPGWEFSTCDKKGDPYGPVERAKLSRGPEGVEF